MENTIVSGNRRTFRAALFGVAMIVLGGTALAATAPAVAPLKFEYTDANGNKIEIKMVTGYEANRLAVDSNGNVYVTDAVSNTVSIFNTNGRLVRQININRPDAIAVDDQNDRIYINGAFAGGIRSIYAFDKNGDPKGPLHQFAWGNPSDIVIGSSGDVYVADSGLNLVRRLSAMGVDEEKVFGPYGNKINANELVYNIKTGLNDTVFRTRHRMRIVQGVAVDEINGNLYIGAKEWIETLNTGCNSVSSAATGDSLSTSGTALICYDDTEESWKYYYDLCPNGSCTNNSVTDSSYKYWNPMDGGTYPYTVKYHILIIDIKEKLDDLSANPAYGMIKRDMIVADKGGDEWFVFMPRDLSIDGKGRLYVAGVGCDGLGIAGCSTAPGKIKVYDVSVDLAQTAPTLMTVSGFTSGIYNDVAFSPDKAAGAPKGRLFAATGGGRTVSSYSIDGGANPLNTAPGKPILLEPANSAAVNTATPTLKIKNATDPQNDPLTYGYEIKNSGGNVVASAAGIISGSNNETLMTVAQGLADSSYRWRVQSFDGELAEWSDEGAFCVDYVNTNPTDPAAIAPVNNAPVSPFASSVYNSLSWTASKDYDCANDAVTYEITVYDNLGNVLKSFSEVASTSINVSDISGLVRGDTYKWTVRAVDSRGGKSGYSEGSFVYKTSVVRFESSQPGTKVYIDGNYGYLGRSLGTASVEVQDITPGLHFVAFVKAGYEPLYKLADVVDPLVNDSAVTVSAKDVEWVTASRIRPSGTGVEIVRLNGGDAVPFVVDYNNDGLKDMIAGDKEGKVYLYLAQLQVQQDETKKVVLIDSGAIQADGSDINAGSKAVPFIVDYNNDGRKDLLVGSGDGLIYLYENSGTDTLPVFASAGSLKDSSGGDIKAANSAPAAVDYNNDGRKDLVVGGFDGKLRLYKNKARSDKPELDDASPEFDATYETIKADNADLIVGSNSRVFFADWNSDGKKDMVVGGNALNLFFNVGTDDAPVFVSIQGLQQWIKDKKRERGNREFIPYLGYNNHDLGDLTGGSGEASPFVVDWSGTSTRDVIVGNGSGGVVNYIAE